MNHDDIARIAKEAGFQTDICRSGADVWIDDGYYVKELTRFAALVAAEKDKEIELLRADAKRLDWCISVLHRQDEKYSYLVTDAGCGCCGEGKTFVCSISGRDAIDAAIRTRGEI
jgi:hypothetical protein